MSTLLKDLQCPSTTGFELGLKPIHGTPYTVRWILDAFGKECLIREEEISNVAVSNINEGSGFVSQILKIVLHLKDKRTCSFVLKVPDSSLIDKSFNGTVSDGNAAYFNREIEFYREFSLTNFPLPTIYKTVLWKPGKATGALLMEDLSQSCFVQPQLLVIAEHLADMHNLYLSLTEEEKQEYQKSFSVLKDCISFRTQIFDPKVRELRDRHPNLLGRKVTPVLEHLADSNYHRYASSTLSDQFNLPRVLVHGDLWSNNILWNSENPSEVAAYIDWQGFFIGNLAFDLSRILVLCTSSSIRRSHTQTVLSHYFSSLKNPTFSKEAVFSAFKETLPYQVAHMMFVIRLLEDTYSKPELEEMLDRVVCVLDDIADHETMYRK
ncbi:hypothetical protein L596_023149 [Steinernema carpocapsae]|uniref:CHK kinase-like domain-containing protein n=1 Tax=Steinernema carpocapsae TaxID=34508 RepID=A0A4U5MCS9_STECR|nr:hypothetical protein L596_023149 [Steinernema carpocapsae]